MSRFYPRYTIFYVRYLLVHKPVVAIIGRPNVGKSSLFNRLISRRLAIVEDIPGVTRDRLYAEVEWSGREFILIDTGGYEEASADVMTGRIREQLSFGIEEADVILFLTDGRQGILPDDRRIAQKLRESGKPVLLVVNKIDNTDMFSLAYDFYELGLGEPLPISSLHGINTGDLLDEILQVLPLQSDQEALPNAVKVAIIGRPNVGKSSIMNSLLGRERVIVSDIPGTTRDAIDSYFTYNGREFLLIDTAGMRRRARVESDVEYYSVVRALRAVDKADICLIVIDAVEGLTEQDKKIAGYAAQKAKSAVIVVNKWDLVQEEMPKWSRTTAKDLSQEIYTLIRSELSFYSFAPIVIVSAKTGRGMEGLLNKAAEVYDKGGQRVATAALNKVLHDALIEHPPAHFKGRRLKLYYATQPQVHPPTILIYVNDTGLLHFSYKRYIENRLRGAFDFEGTPLRIIFKKRD